VERPDLYDPQINLAYGELAAFYGTLIDPTCDASDVDTNAVLEKCDGRHIRSIEGVPPWKSDFAPCP
jgi:hypothetical protein